MRCHSYFPTFAVSGGSFSDIVNNGYRVAFSGGFADPLFCLRSALATICSVLLMFLPMCGAFSAVHSSQGVYTVCVTGLCADMVFTATGLALASRQISPSFKETWYKFLFLNANWFSSWRIRLCSSFGTSAGPVF